MLQKWEKALQGKSMLHATTSMTLDGSIASIAEASSTLLDPVPPSSIPSGIVVATTSSHHQDCV